MQTHLFTVVGPDVWLLLVVGSFLFLTIQRTRAVWKHLGTLRQKRTPVSRP